MGSSQKSHGHKSNKGTQSPILKVFKDIMQKEKCDPEKTNLLNDKHAERKRKHYSGSRTKTHKIMESSSSDMKHEHYNKDHETRNTEFGSRSRSLPFPNEKRESWWFWGDTAAGGEKSKGDDTCSCVSCALKKLVSNDHACVICLVILFVISVGVAVMLVYKSVPCLSGGDSCGKPKPAPKPPCVRFDMDGDRLKRKANGRWNFDINKPWLNILRRKSANPGYSGFNLQDVSSIVEPQSDLARIFDVDKINDVHTSDRLKSFYRKLVETDNAIRNLKKTYNDNSLPSSSYVSSDFDMNNDLDFNSDINFDSKFDSNSKLDLTYPDRMKRSIKFFHRPGFFDRSSIFHKPKFFHIKRRHHSTTTKSKIDKGKVVSKTFVNMTAKTPDKPRNKRFDKLNGTEGIVIEKNTVLIQYNKPTGNRIVPKCSHAPKDSKSHEIQLNHPFYKNTQRLDELLDQFLDRKLPDLLSDQFEDMIVDKKKCKHPINDEVVIVKDDDSIISKADKEFPIENETPEQTLIKDEKTEQSGEKDLAKEDKEEPLPEKVSKEKETGPKKIAKLDTFENDFLDDADTSASNGEGTTSSFDVLLSISTLINPTNGAKRTTAPTAIEKRQPSLRKLMQSETDGEEADEDLNEMIETVSERGEELAASEMAPSLGMSTSGVKLRKLMQADDGEDNVDEELKDIIADEKESGEDTQIDRNGRGELHTVTVEPVFNQNPINIHNPNWKGPMPLYPEELNLMAKQAKKEAFPIQNPDNAPETDESEMGLADVDYVENYLFNGYEKLVKLAQAYSDYGVLDGKKETERKSDKIDHNLQSRRATIPSRFDRFKHGLRKSGLLGRLKKGTRPVSEGIRIEMHPTSDSVEDTDLFHLKKFVGSHVKFSQRTTSHLDKLNSAYPPPSIPTDLKDIDKFRSSKTFSTGTVFPFNKRRTLKSVGVQSETENLYNIVDITKLPMLPNIEAVKVKRDIITFGKEPKDKTDTTTESNSETTNDDSNSKKDIQDESFFTAENKNVNGRVLKREASEIGTSNGAQKNNMTMSDFFMLLSKWFSALDGAHVTVNQTDVAGANVPSSEAVVLDVLDPKTYVTENTGTPKPLKAVNAAEDVQFKTRSLLAVEKNKNTPKTDNSEDEKKSDHFVSLNAAILFPKTTEMTPESSNAAGYVHYKSRALLSIEDNNNTVKAELKSEEEEESNADISSSTASEQNTNVTSTDITPASSKAVEEMRTDKRKFKRQAEESSLVFWNDLYDDEYGLKNDMQTNVRDKHSANKNDLVQKFVADKNDIIKKSNLWFQDKFNMLTNTLNKVGSFRRGAHRMSRSATDIRDGDANDDAVDTNDPGNAKVDFAALTAKMKEVCKRTAQEVQQTKNVQVREEEKGGFVSSSLMQQLVRLMTDLVDFQVQERTCRKLPPDLQTFLEWLTSPHKEKTSEEESNSIPTEKREKDEFEKLTEQDVVQPDRDPTDSRTDCLGTLHAVQDLVKQYDDMSDDDKSLMTGVKDYLENQISYLQKYLATYEDYKLYREEPRSKRDLIARTGNTIAKAIDSTARTLQNEYDYLKYRSKHIYNKIAGKVKHATKLKHKTTSIVEKLTSTTKKIKEKVMAAAKKIKNKVSKYKHKHGSDKNENCVKEKCKTNKDAHLKTKEHKAHHKLHKDTKTHMKQIYKNRFHHKEHEKKHETKAKEERNIQDVYFKAIEEAKKGFKNRKTTETYDKADISN